MIQIRAAEKRDVPEIAAFFRQIVEAGETYAYPEGLTDEQIAELWLEPAPSRCIVAVDEHGRVVGSAKMGPNRPARGSHVSTASFMVDPAAQGRGIGRTLAGEIIRLATGDGYHSMQFNAVVETNHSAVKLWQSFGFEILATIPEAFDHRRLGLVGLHVMYRKL